MWMIACSFTDMGPICVGKPSGSKEQVQICAALLK